MPPTSPSPVVAAAAELVPEQHYTHHPGRGKTVHRTNPVFVHRDLTLLDVEPSMKVVDIGTGSGLTGALLSEIVGPSGSVTSLDIDAYLTRWTNHIHAERGRSNVRCVTADGTAGYPQGGPYHRLGAWCSPPRLPLAWVNQLVDGGLIVATLPLADVPNLAVGVKIRITNGQPHVEHLFPGAYIETANSPRTDFTVPARWVDWEYRTPTPSWASISWRTRDDWLGTGARAVLDMLRTPARHTETYTTDELAWGSLRLWLAATGTDLTMTELTPDLLGLGHSTPTSAAVIQTDGTLLADSAASPSLELLRCWLGDWEKAGRPALDAYTPTLVPALDGNVPGWDLRLAL